MTSPLERASAYAQKIQQLSMCDTGLSEWLQSMQTKGISSIHNSLFTIEAYDYLSQAQVPGQSVLLGCSSILAFLILPRGHQQPSNKQGTFPGPQWPPRQLFLYDETHIQLRI